MLQVRYAPWFDADVQFRTAWYAERGGPGLADRFIAAVEATVRKLADNPLRGRRPYPKDRDLHDIHLLRIGKPFHKYMLYYRFTSDALILERLIHGARDLPRRLRDSPLENE